MMLRLLFASRRTRIGRRNGERGGGGAGSIGHGEEGGEEDDRRDHASARRQGGGGGEKFQRSFLFGAGSVGPIFRAPHNMKWNEICVRPEKVLRNWGPIVKKNMWHKSWYLFTRMKFVLLPALTLTLCCFPDLAQ